MVRSFCAVESMTERNWSAPSGELTAYMPQLESVSVVPVGLTRYRDGLYPLEPFTKEDACEVLDLIHGWQEKALQGVGQSFYPCG